MSNLQLRVDRAAAIRARLRRRHLIFLQLGAAFKPIESELIAGIGGTVIDASRLLTVAAVDGTLPPLVVTGIDVFAFNGESLDGSIGQLRAKVDEFLDADVDVCLVSAQPRIAFYDAPGSSLIEDSSFCALPLLDEVERTVAGASQLVSPLPSLGQCVGADLDSKLVEIVGELGAGLLAALDYYLFEVGSGPDFVDLLEPRELEALRGAGLVTVEPVVFAVPLIFSNFKSAVADCLADEIAPQHELGRASEGLWVIERRIRRRLRGAASSQLGQRWRRSVLPQDLAEKVLDRARRDTNVTARTLSDLRDPIEWLSLGELLQVVRSKSFAGLGIDEITWKKFEQDLLPIRNRLAHMRFLKRGDPSTVGMWLNRVKNW